MDFGIMFWIIVIAGVLVLLVASNIVLWVISRVIRMSVAVKESRRPPHIDAGDYRLDQGREVRDERRER